MGILKVNYKELDMDNRCELALLKRKARLRDEVATNLYEGWNSYYVDLYSSGGQASCLLVETTPTSAVFFCLDNVDFAWFFMIDSVNLNEVKKMRYNLNRILILVSYKKKARIVI